MGFGLLDNPLGDDMIRMALKPGFPAREFLEMPFRALRPALLQALTQAMMALAVLLDHLTTKGFPLAIGGKVDDAQVNTERLGHFIGRGCGDIQRHSQKERPLALEEISLSFDTVHPGLLVAADAEGNQNAPRERQERDGQQSLETHHPLIVGNRTFWPEGGVGALIAFIGFTGLATGAYRQVCRQLGGTAHLCIGLFLQCKRISRLFCKRHARYVVTGRIEGVHGVQQGAVLFFSWSKLQEHRLVHRTNVSCIEKNVNRARETRDPTLAPQKERRIPPRG